MEKIRVLLIDALVEERKDITRMLKNVEYIVMSGEFDSYQKVEPKDYIEIDVALVAIHSKEDGYAFTAKMIERNPSIIVVLIEDEINEEILQKTIRAGARNVLLRPLTPERVIDAIYQAGKYLEEKAVEAGKPVREVKKSYGRGQVYTVSGSKGGTGRTFVSVNLAIAIRKMTNKRVALLDLDLDFGNVALALNILPRFTIMDIVDDIHNMDADMMESYLMTHETGIKILPSGVRPVQTEFMGPEEIAKIIYLLQDSFDYVVIDLPPVFSENLTAAYTTADKLVVITVPEVAALRNTKIALATLDDLNYLNAKVKLVLNKFDKKGKIRKKDVETTLNKEITGSIAYDRKNVMASMNLGDPIILQKGQKEIKSDFAYLVKKLVDNTELHALR